MDRRTYRFGESTLTVTNERIVDSQADVIVSTGSTALRGSGGLSKALIERAGGAVSGDTAKFDNLRIGDVVVTSAGYLPAHWLFHCITKEPGTIPPAPVMKTSLRRMTKRCFELAASLDAKSISFPLLGGGLAAYPVELIAAEMSDVLVVEMLKSPTSLDATIHIYERFNPDRAGMYLGIFDDFLQDGPRLTTDGDEPEALGRPEGDSSALAAIAFFAADPPSYTNRRLGLGEEWRMIDDAIWQSEFRTKLEIHPIWATRPKDIQRWLNRKRPSIVHFAGHAEDDGSLVLDSGNGDPARVTPVDLADLLGDFSDTIRCVVLNACFTMQAADALLPKLGCIIGTTSAVQDSAAAAFSASFYGSIGYGNNIRDAYVKASHQIPVVSGMPNLHEIAERDQAGEVVIVA